MKTFIPKISSSILPALSIKQLKLGLLLGSTVLASACGSLEQHVSAEAKVAQQKPNILFILADDHRWDLIGKYHPIVLTPNLDKLANKGLFFKKAFVTTPICATSRTSIMTGLTERTHDNTFQRPPASLADMATAYPALLKKHGYNSALVGKYEVNLSGKTEDRFDYFKELLISKTGVHNGKEMPQTYHIVELAKDFIEQNKTSGKPWTMSVNFWNPHSHDHDKKDQYHYPAEFDDYYENINIPPAKFSDDASFAALPEFLKQTEASKRQAYRFSNEELFQKMIKRHYRAVSAVDKGVGMIYDKLVEAGMEKNTVIIYMGDNGYALNERQLAGKWFGWEEDLRVPLIIFDPRNNDAHGRVSEKVALNIDIAPTILALAGVEVPERYQGKSLTPILDDQQTEWRKDFFFEHMYQPKRTFIPPMVGVRSEDWKYVRFYKNNHEQLYNLKEDPREEINLAKNANYQTVLNELRQRTNYYIDKYEAERSEEVKQRGLDGNPKTDFVNSGSKNF